MKPNRAFTIVVGIILAGSWSSQAASYTNVSAPGWTLNANQLDSPNGNNIRNVIPTAPQDAQVIRFNRATRAFDAPERFTFAAGWLPGTTVLNPGDGFYFFNPSANNFSLAFIGNPHVPQLPLNLSPGFALVARQTNDVANVTNILGVAPPNLTVVYRFNPGSGRDPGIFAPPNYTIYPLKGGVWLGTNGPPNNIRVGESVWITTNGSLPVLTEEPKSQTVCPTNRVDFTAAATGTPPLSYQWFFNNSPIANATTPSYTIPVVRAADQGAYSVQISNPLGTTNSSNVVLTVGDLEPPKLFCPTGLTSPCRGPGGTSVGFQIGISDNCDPNPKVVADPPAGSLFPAGTTTVHVTGYDASGNSNFCSFTVTVVDQLPPSVTCPADRVVAATSSAGARVNFGIFATDNCDANPSVSATPASGSLFPIGTTPVTGVAVDSAGHSNSCTFDVTVVPPGCCDGKLWHAADVAGPNARLAHSMAYDSARGRVVMFGGSSQGGLRGDTWEWNGTGWTLMASTGPNPRSFTALAYDSRLARTILYGGYDGTNAFGDTWVWDGASWQSLNPTNSPGPRYGHAMAYDAARGRTVLFGGTPATGAVLGDTWEFNGTQWLPVPKAPVQPSPRTAHAMTYDSAHGQLLLFGGEEQNTAFFGDTWNWNGAGWTLLSSTGPVRRAFHAMAYNDNCDSAVLFGGSSGNIALSDTWEWNGTAWTLTASNPPSARLAHAMAHDSARGQTVLFGGSGGQGGLGDTWLYAPAQTSLQVRSTYAACGDQRIVVAFSAPVSAASAQDLSNYRLACDGVPVSGALTGAILTDDARIVWLLTAQPFSRCGCLLVVDGVQDACGHVLRGYQAGLCCTNEPCLRGSSGTEYWLTFPGNYAPDRTNPPMPQLFIAGAPGVAGTVSMPVYGTWPPAAFTIPPSGVATVTLPAEADLGNANDVIQTNGIHVVASQPVAVYGLNHIRYTTDAYLGLSTRGLGLAHFVMAYRNVFTGVPELNGVQLALAAAQDGTTVTIVPSVNVTGHSAGLPFNLTLMQGQTYQLRATNDAPADLSGTFVVADQPIAVFGSHQCANIPSSNQFFADYIVEQIPPVETWGASFITAPLAGRLSGDTFRIMAMVNGTTVTVNGSVLPALNRGKFHELQLAGSSQITSDKPVLVAQFADSSDYDFALYSDPFMVLVPPISAYSSSYILQAPTTDFPTNYVNLMTPAALVGQILLDGAIIPVASYSPVGASGFFTAQVKVGTGPHTLITFKGLPFGAIAYGWGQYDSYAYPGSSCNSTQSVPPRFTCPPPNLVVQAGAGCLGVMPDLSSQVGNASAALAILQEPPAGALLEPGTHPVSLTIIDILGLRHPCNSTLTVNRGSGPGLICPPDIVTNCVSTNGQVVTFHVGLCNTNFTLVSTPPSGSLFPPGITKVSCVASNTAGVIERCSFNVTVDCIVLSAVPVGNNLTISWSGGGVLQKAEAVTGPWITLSNATSPYRLSISGAKGFLRVKQ